jgi:hypothetical protein
LLLHKKQGLALESTRRSRRQLHLGAHEDLLLAARQALADPTTAEHLRRTRPRIERLLGPIAHRYGTRKSRYIGRAKARLQAAWAAALVDLNPIARRLYAQTDNRPTTPIIHPQTPPKRHRKHALLQKSSSRRTPQGVHSQPAGTSSP